MVSTIGAQANPQKRTEPGLWKGKRALLACHTPCKCSMETTHNSVKVKLGIKVMELVESLISWEVTVCQGSECHLTFVKGRLHKISEDQHCSEIENNNIKRRRSTIGYPASKSKGTMHCCEPGYQIQQSNERLSY